MSVNKTEFSHFFRVMTTSIINSPALDGFRYLSKYMLLAGIKVDQKSKLLLRLKIRYKYSLLRLIEPGGIVKQSVSTD